jgi:hypothetical protein
MKILKELGEVLITLVIILVGFLVIGTAFVLLRAMIVSIIDLF